MVTNAKLPNSVNWHSIKTNFCLKIPFVMYNSRSNHDNHICYDIKIMFCLDNLHTRLKEWLRYRVWVIRQLENFYCHDLLGICMEPFGKVNVVSESGAVFHTMLLFSFVLKGLTEKEKMLKNKILRIEKK